MLLACFFHHQEAQPALVHLHLASPCPNACAGFPGTGTASGPRQQQLPEQLEEQALPAEQQQQRQQPFTDTHCLAVTRWVLTQKALWATKQLSTSQLRYLTLCGASRGVWGEVHRRGAMRAGHLI